MKLPIIKPEYKTPLYYFFFGVLWIILSDRIVAALVVNPHIITEIQTYKGWFFVIASTALICFSLHRHYVLERVADQELREDEERLRLLYEMSYDGILLTSPDGSIYTANPSACAMLGYTEEEICLLGRAGVVDQTDPRLIPALERRNKTGRFITGLRFIKKDGSTFEGEVSSTLFKNRHGQTRTSMIIRDLTDRKRSEEALRQSEKKFSVMFKKSAFAASLSSMTDGKLIDVNEKFTEVFGFSVQEAIGKTSFELGINPDQTIREKLLSNLREHGFSRSNIVQLRSRSGKQKTMSVNLDVLEIDGEKYILNTTQDISEQENTKRDLLIADERLNLALTASHQGIYDSNLKTGEININNIYAEMLGYDPDTFIESYDHWLGRMHPDDRKKCKKALSDYLKGNIPVFSIEFRQKTTSGKWIWLFSIGSIVERDEQGAPVRMVGTHTNITETKETEIKINELYGKSQQRLKRIEALHEIDLAISSNLSLENTLQNLITQVKNHLLVDAVAILLYDEKSDTLFQHAHLGFKTNRIENTRVQFGKSLAGKAAAEGKLIKLPKIKDEIDPFFRSFLAEEEIAAYYSYPLISKQKLVGVLEAYYHSPFNPDSEWIHFFTTLAGQAAIAIESAKLHDGLQKANDEILNAYDATIEGWSNALDLRDKETEGHTLRVAEMAVDFARILNFKEDQLIHIRRGALLHDIGKIAIPDAILLRPGKLTPSEWGNHENTPSIWV